MRTNFHVLEALREMAKQPCNRSNCGTICLCGSCHARKALPKVEQRELQHFKRKRRKYEQLT